MTHNKGAIITGRGKQWITSVVTYLTYRLLMVSAIKQIYMEFSQKAEFLNTHVVLYTFNQLSKKVKINYSHGIFKYDTSMVWGVKKTVTMLIIILPFYTNNVFF